MSTDGGKRDGGILNTTKNYIICGEIKYNFCFERLSMKTTAGNVEFVIELPAPPLNLAPEEFAVQYDQLERIYEDFLRYNFVVLRD